MMWPRFLDGEVKDGVYKPYHVDEFNFGTANRYQINYRVALLIALVMVAIFAVNGVQRRRVKYLAEAGAVISIGFVSSLIFHLMKSQTTDSLMSFKTDYFFVFLLPPILFNGGYSIRRRFFFEHLAAILSFAIIGPVLSTICFGSLLWFAGLNGFISPVLSFAESLTFGALISATDPVSVLAIFEKQRVEPTLFYIVFGESLLNDAVSLVLFDTSSKFIGYDHSAQSLSLAIMDFFIIFIGSTALGIVFGCICAFIFKHANLKSNRLHECAIYIFFPYIPFLFAEIVDMSGIVAVAFTAIAMKNLAHENLSTESRPLVVETFKLLAYIAETLVFLSLGLSVFSLQEGWHFGFIIVSLVLCLVSRAALVYPIAFILNLCYSKQNRLSISQQTMLWFSGLRGAVAFALSLAFPGNQRETIVCTTLAIVLFSVFIMGGLTEPMMEYLRIKTLSAADELNIDLNPKRGWLEKVIDTFLKPLFTLTGPIVSPPLTPTYMKETPCASEENGDGRRILEASFTTIEGAQPVLRSRYTLSRELHRSGSSQTTILYPPLTFANADEDSEAEQYAERDASRSKEDEGESEKQDEDIRYSREAISHGKRLRSLSPPTLTRETSIPAVDTPKSL